MTKILIGYGLLVIGFILGLLWQSMRTYDKLLFSEWKNRRLLDKLERSEYRREIAEARYEGRAPNLTFKNLENPYSRDYSERNV